MLHRGIVERELRCRKMSRSLPRDRCWKEPTVWNNSVVLVPLSKNVLVLCGKKFVLWVGGWWADGSEAACGKRSEWLSLTITKTSPGLFTHQQKEELSGDLCPPCVDASSR